MGTGTPGLSAQVASPWAGSNPRCCSRTSSTISSKSGKTDGRSLREREGEEGKCRGNGKRPAPTSLSPDWLGPGEGVRSGPRPQPRSTRVPSARAPRPAARASPRNSASPQPPLRDPDTHSHCASAAAATSDAGHRWKTRAPWRALPGPV